VKPSARLHHHTITPSNPSALYDVSNCTTARIGPITFEVTKRVLDGSLPPLHPQTPLHRIRPLMRACTPNPAFLGKEASLVARNWTIFFLVARMLDSKYASRAEEDCSCIHSCLLRLAVP
jgi:hypothetical protein